MEAYAGDIADDAETEIPEEVNAEQEVLGNESYAAEAWSE